MIVLLMVNTHAAVYIRVEAIRDQKSMAFNVQLSAGVRFISQANPGTSHNLCYWVPCVANVNLYMLVYIILKYSRLQQVKKNRTKQKGEKKINIIQRPTFTAVFFFSKEHS